MGEPRVTVLARFKAKEGLEAEAEQAIAACVSPTRAEAGCINYDLHRSHDDKGTFILYENWVSRKAHDLEMPYLRILKAKATELFVGPIDISLWERI
jgi:quinol monooxygenase YgiN